MSQNSNKTKCNCRIINTKVILNEITTPPRFSKIYYTYLPVVSLCVCCFLISKLSFSFMPQAYIKS